MCKSQPNCWLRLVQCVLPVHSGKSRELPAIPAEDCDGAPPRMKAAEAAERTARREGNMLLPSLLDSGADVMVTAQWRGARRGTEIERKQAAGQAIMSMRMDRGRNMVHRDCSGRVCAPMRLRGCRVYQLHHSTVTLLGIPRWTRSCLHP